MKEKKTIEARFIDGHYDYLFTKYIYKRVLEKKYIDHFGQYELDKMKSIYEAVLVNKKVESSFVFGELEYPAYIDYLAKKEYADLARQIRELRHSLAHNKEEEERLNNYINKSGLKEDLYLIIERSNPTLNSNSKAEQIWIDLLEVLEAGEFSKIKDLKARAKKIRLLKNKEEDLEEILKSDLAYLEKEKKELTSYFPFNQEEIFQDEKLIQEKTRAIKEDVLSAKESVEKMYDLLLYTSQPTKWDN